MVAKALGAKLSEVVASTRLTGSPAMLVAGEHGPDLAMKSETLIRAADQCLYTSKQSGRNRTTGVEIPTVLAQSANG